MLCLTLAFTLTVSQTTGAQSISWQWNQPVQTIHVEGHQPSIPASSLPRFSRADPSEIFQSSSSHTELENLLRLENQIKQIVPVIQECVVSVEGGCGFVANETGLVITVSHVSKRAGRQVTVKFSDGSTRQAVTLGSNRANDTGALQLLGMGPWKHLQLADGSEARVGQWCLAFGYPIEFDRNKKPAVRIGQVTKILPDRIITDCLIMGGDSGGPLINLDGHVIAINSGVTTSVAKNVHVPTAVFNDNRAEILAGMDLTHPRSELQKIYFGVVGETDDERVRISRVFKGSPAEAAGIEKDDVILSLNGKSLDSFTQFLSLLDQHRPGESVFAKVNRYGQVFDLVVELQQR